MKWSKAGLLLTLFNLWLFFMAILDHIVHSRLYEYGLRFSLQWADPYWIVFNLIFGATFTLTAVNLKKSRKVFGILFTMVGEWVGMFLDSLFYLIHGEFPSESVNWFWMPFSRFFGIRWTTSMHLTYNFVWLVLIVAVWIYIFCKDHKDSMN